MYGIDEHSMRCWLMKPIERVVSALYLEEPDAVPDGRDIAVVPGPIQKRTIKEVPGIRVWSANFGSVHITISHEVTLRRKGPDAEYTWEYLVSPAIRWPEDLQRQEQPELDMDLVKLVKDGTQELHRKGYFVRISHHGAFDIPRRYLRGTKQWLIDIVKDPSFARKLIDFAMKPVMEISNALIEETGIDAVRIVGDMGTPQGPFISPTQYRELIYPWHRRLAKSYRKRGAFFEIHSHGYLMPIMDDMVRAGFDLINPVSPLCNMNLAEMKERYGNKVALQAAPAFPSENGLDKVKYGRIINGQAPARDMIESLEHTLEIGAAGGGLVLAQNFRRFSNDKDKEIVIRAWEKMRRYK